MKLFALILTEVLGHGRFMDPPGRSSYQFFKDDPAIEPYLDKVLFNYDDNQLFCGGFPHEVAQGNSRKLSTLNYRRTTQTTHCYYSR